MMNRRQPLTALAILLMALLHVSTGLCETPSPASDIKDAHNGLDDLFTLYQPYFGDVGFYEPIYYVVGIEPDKSKGQLSMKYRFFHPRGSWSQSRPWLQGFHIAYTQITFWDLETDSKPSLDTSYKPELFYQSSNLDWFASRNSQSFIQAGLQHESNGQSGDDSRGTNLFYLKPMVMFRHESSRFVFAVTPKVWLYLSNEDEDLKDYRGYFELGLACGRANSVLLRSNVYWAAKGPSIQLDLTYPVRELLFNNLNFYLQAQYTNSLAEGLLDFRERTQVLRFGLALVR